MIRQKLAELARTKVEGSDIQYYLSLKELVWTEFLELLRETGAEPSPPVRLAAAIKAQEERLPEAFRKNMEPLVKVLMSLQDFQLVNPLDGRPTESEEASEMAREFIADNASGIQLLLNLLRDRERK